MVRKKRATPETVESALRQLDERFMADVAAGVYRSGELLPGVRKLAAHYGTSFPVGYRYYRLLESRGRILALPRKGMVLLDAHNGESALPAERLRRDGIAVVGWLECEHPEARFNFNYTTLCTVEEECRKAGIPMRFYNLHRPGGGLDFRVSPEVIDAINANHHAGAIVLPDQVASDPELLRLEGPRVGLGKTLLEQTIDVDETGDGDIATQHLLELGHTRIILLGYDCDTSWMRDREAGYRRTMRKAGLEPAIRRFPYDQYRLRTDLPPRLEALLPELKQEFSAALCASDEPGRIILDYERRNPDLPPWAIVTFGDYNEYRSWNMTSLRTPDTVQALTGFEQLCGRILHPDMKFASIRVTGNLYVRDTSHPFLRSQPSTKEYIENEESN